MHKHNGTNKVFFHIETGHGLHCIYSLNIYEFLVEHANVRGTSVCNSESFSMFISMKTSKLYR